MKNSVLVKFTVFLFLGLLSPAYADVIHLKDGSKLNGDVIKQNKEAIWLEVFIPNGRLVRKIDRSQIKSMEVDVSKEALKKEDNAVTNIIKKIISPQTGPAQTHSSEAKTINDPKYILYLPSNINLSKKYPLVVAFSPSADAAYMIGLWKNISEKYKLVIAASKEFRNNVDPENAFSTMISLIKSGDLKYPIDKSRVITSGVSGGGMAAHMFSVSYPDFTWAVISNCGRIHPDYIEKERNLYARNKLAVFLASPTDFNYGYMKNDQKFLATLDWKTKWIEFSGGHIAAPESAYQEAAEWLNEQLK
ncbi:MAG: hypothetical protein V1699_04250 [Candidatus Omnitrophota bacterium]